MQIPKRWTQGLPKDAAAWRKVAVLTTLMMAHDLPNTLTATLIPTVFVRSLDMPLEYLGLFSIPVIVIALKWLWAPLLDRHGSTRIGWRKSWLIPSSVGVALCFVAIGAVQPSLDVLYVIIALLILKQVFYATYEIAGDAYIVENLTPEERGSASSMIWLGREFGQFIGFAGLLFIADRVGWSAAFYSAAALYLLFNLPIFIRAEPKRERTPIDYASIVAHFRVFFARHHNWRILSVVFFISFAVQMPVTIIGPFLSDRGLSLSEIGIVIGVSAGLGAIVSLGLSTPLMGRFGPKRMAVAMLFIAPLAFPGFVWMSIADASTLAPLTVGIIVFWSALCTAPVRMIVYAARIGWTSSDYVGTDFTVQQSTWFLGFAASGAAAGLLASQLGWAGFFTLNLLLQLAAIVYFITSHDGIDLAIRQLRDKS